MSVLHTPKQLLLKLVVWLRAQPENVQNCSQNHGSHRDKTLCELLPPLLTDHLRPDLVQDLADHRVESKGKPNIGSHLDAPRQRSCEEDRDTFIPEHLHRAIQRSLVKFLGLLALHARFHAILRLSQEDRTNACHGPGDAIVDRVFFLGLVAKTDHREELKLQRHPHGLVARLLQDGGQSAAVEAKGALTLQNLHDRISGALVVAGAAAHVVIDSCLDGLHRRHSTNGLHHSCTEAANRVSDDRDLAFVISEQVGDVGVGTPAEHLLESSTEDPDTSPFVEPSEAMVLNRLLEAFYHVGVLRVALRLQLHLRLAILKWIRHDNHGTARHESLHHALCGVLFLHECHCDQSR
mmetsp:Transcript_29464/g.57726  ORF Transcript_29464/g.57726 Transcript_29464/m.57726 type:complete len:351 (+) Transcript_29464:185-1237(+)